MPSLAPSDWHVTPRKSKAQPVLSGNAAGRYRDQLGSGYDGTVIDPPVDQVTVEAQGRGHPMWEGSPEAPSGLHGIEGWGAATDTGHCATSERACVMCWIYAEAFQNAATALMTCQVLPQRQRRP